MDRQLLIDALIFAVATVGAFVIVLWPTKKEKTNNDR
jgi:hypothetical protein